METAATLAFLATILGAAWRLATPLIFAATGEAIGERSASSTSASKASC